MDSDEAEETRREVEHELGVVDDTRWEVVYTYCLRQIFLTGGSFRK